MKGSSLIGRRSRHGSRILYKNRLSIIFSRFYKRFIVQNHFERNYKGLLSLGGFAAMVQGYCTRIDVNYIFKIFQKVYCTIIILRESEKVG